MIAWLLVGVIVAATTASEVIQTHGMKAHGEIDDFHPTALRRALGAVFRRWQIPVSILLMAVSFFSFLSLLSQADLSFAVPATAATFVLETLLAKFILKERVSAQRWAGASLVACGVALLAVG